MPRKRKWNLLIPSKSLTQRKKVQLYNGKVLRFPCITSKSSSESYPRIHLYFFLFSLMKKSHEQLAIPPKKCLSTMRETWVLSLGREVPWRRKRQPTPELLPRKSHGQRSLVSMGSQRVGHDWATSLSLSAIDLLKTQLSSITSTIECIKNSILH